MSINKAPVIKQIGLKSVLSHKPKVSYGYVNRRRNHTYQVLLPLQYFMQANPHWRYTGKFHALFSIGYVLGVFSVFCSLCPSPILALLKCCAIKLFFYHKKRAKWISVLCRIHSKAWRVIVTFNLAIKRTQRTS